MGWLLAIVSKISLLHGAVELMMVAVWYFFSDVYPPLHQGHKPLDPPNWWIRLFEGRRDDIEETEETEAVRMERDIAAAAGPGLIG